ncbi:MAG: endonuclease MutS2 [Bacillota bacterium]|jgi:DNA mismatch repair protein MutS2
MNEDILVGIEFDDEIIEINKYWHKLEFDKIMQKLAAECSFSMTKEMAFEIKPKKTIEKTRDTLTETSEAADILRLYPMYSLGHVVDIREALKRAELGGVLNIQELVNIADTCRAARLNKDFFSQLKGQFPALQAYARNVSIFKTVESAVERAVTPEMTVADTASERLYSIRKRMHTHQNRIKERLDNFIKNPNTSKFLQEPIVTIRDGRFVVPVKQEYRASVSGVVHDMSSSGATLFVEPMAVMEANNELHKLKIEEQDEISAILRALTNVVAGFKAEIEATLYALAKLDFVFARARLSVKMNGSAPKINENGIINLKKARHPLIGSNVVPIDVNLDSSLKTMVITGPNTGGKTVTLKTVGLLTLMALSGLHIPADDGSELAFFDQIFADIGDEQSIEQNLSTFSAHMTNIVYIMNHADFNSLVLLDELGSGTDPTEGAALAMSILEQLYKVGSKVCATTHYSELKSFAYNKTGFINASVEFDVETLRPTYRLQMGIPGKSNAFEISKKLGLDESIINRANSFLTADEQQVADLITNLEENSLKAEESRREADLRLAQIAEQERQFKIKETELHNKEVAIIKKAHEEALEIVKKARSESEELYQSMKIQLKNAGVMGKDVQKTREKMKRLQSKHHELIPEEKYLGTAPAKVELGQRVEIPKYRQRGTILTLPDAKGELQVQVGIMKINVNIDDLRIDKTRDDKERSFYTNKVRSNKAKEISPEIDLRGMTLDEAIEAMDKYLDDAFLTNIKQVRVIHGKGTGALRAGLTPYLQKHRLVKKTRMGDYHEGGFGVTVVELK